jgi:glycosyltransferase involved in cell wall biosynthesis
MLRVLFLTHSFATPGVRWELLNLVPYFEQSGIGCTVRSIPDSWLKRFMLLRSSKDFDIVFWHKKLMAIPFAKILRRYARKIVYHFSDAIFFKIRGTEVYPSSSRERKFKFAVQNSDIVVAVNDYLAQKAREFTETEKVKVIPTPVDLQKWKLKDYTKTSKSIVIGFTASKTTLPYLKFIYEPLGSIQRRYPHVVLRILSRYYIKPDLPRFEYWTYDANREPDDTCSFDIGISPLIETEWTKGKRPTKILGYFAAGVPVVASDVYCNRLYIEDGKNGFLASSPQEWQEKLERLILDPSLRYKIGIEGRRTVEQEYSMQKIIPKYLEMFFSLVESIHKV